MYIYIYHSNKIYICQGPDCHPSFTGSTPAETVPGFFRRDDGPPCAASPPGRAAGSGGGLGHRAATTSQKPARCINGNSRIHFNEGAVWHFLGHILGLISPEP